MIEYFEKRPNVPVLMLLVLFILGAFAYPIAIGENVSTFLHRNAAVMFLGVVALLIPLFVQATKATLLSDLLDEKMASKWVEYLSEVSNFDDAPLKMSVARLYLAKADSRSSSMKNLALGVGFSVVSVTLIIQLAVAVNTPEVLALPTDEFLVKHVGPKLAAVLFVQLTGGFFLRHYSRNLQEISIIGDKLLFVEIKLAAYQVSDLHREKLQNFLVEFDLESALTSQKKRPSFVRIPAKGVENFNLTVGK